ncbi:MULTISPECIES: hypothetical protein [unclassified Bradyrhizobium]|uniref:hypothetical protein n=1 Tax=unclassified Bradyrhizobium TaxID=2631580 RepID=UPI003391A8C7
MQKNPTSLFVSFKATRAIPVRNAIRRDFMIQSTLDPGVRRIEYHPTSTLFDRLVRVDALVLDRDDGRFAVDFVDTRSAEDPDGEAVLQVGFDEHCSGLLAVGDADVRREPLFTSAREVWRHAGINIHAADRAQVLETLESEGPVPVRALKGLTDTSREVVQVIYALACEGSVALDLRSPLDDRAIVCVGFSAKSAHVRYGT